MPRRVWLRYVQTLWEIARREVEVREQSAKLAHLEEAFGKIQVRQPSARRPSPLRHFPAPVPAQESTGITTIDEMVTAFVTAEDRNYAILTMINDLNQVRWRRCEAPRPRRS